MDIIKIENLAISFGGLQALKGVNLNIKQGEIYGIIGPNGAGKTTLFNVICGLDQPDMGHIFFNGIDIVNLKAHQIAALGIARTFQLVQLFKDMTVLENVMTGLHQQLRTNIFSASLSLRKMQKEEHEAKEKALEMLRFMKMETFADRFASDLSFGQQRLVEISRALVSEPKLLLLDEPAAGLSIVRVPALTETLKKIREEKRVTILLVEHVLRLVLGISDKVLVLNYGEKIAEGSPEEVRDDQKVIEAYLGRSTDARN